MKIICLLIFLITTFLSIDPQAKTSFNQLISIIQTEPIGSEVMPKTTKELEELFNTPQGTIPRVFVKKLPLDFKEKGSKELYAKVITALVLRENEKILGERSLFLILKEKADQGVKWTKTEEQFFNSLVEKYDSIILKTIPTKIADLFYKIEEIPPSLAIAQSAHRTNWGKENLDSPYAQKSWLTRDKYDYTPYDNLIKATSSYTLEMNATPNYDQWRRIRMENQGMPQAAFIMSSALRVYLPENVDYISQIQEIFNQNKFIYNFDQSFFQKEKK